MIFGARIDRLLDTVGPPAVDAVMFALVFDATAVVARIGSPKEPPSTGAPDPVPGPGPARTIDPRLRPFNVTCTT